MVTTRQALRSWRRHREPTLADIARGEVWQARARAANRLADLRALAAGYCNHCPYRGGLPDSGGGYAHWRCALARGHPAPHRGVNYVWDAGGVVHYAPVPPGKPCPSQPWRRHSVPTRRQAGARNRRDGPRAVRLPRLKLVVDIGRRRLMVRFGRCRFGLRRVHPGAFTFGAGFCCGNYLSRANSAAPRWSVRVGDPRAARAGGAPCPT